MIKKFFYSNKNSLENLEQSKHTPKRMTNYEIELDREIRELTWKDFSDDLSFIHLSGNRNKSGRNRIVPVPSYVRDLLNKGERHHNIFSGRQQPLNQDYFKTLWGRFKRQPNFTNCTP